MSELIEVLPDEEEEEEILEEINLSDEDDLFVEGGENEIKPIIKHIFHKFLPPKISKDNFAANTTAIKLNRDDLAALITMFEPTYDNFDLCIKFLFKSPYKADFILPFVISWYTQGEYNQEASIRDFFNEWYTPVKTNEWFFKIVNQLHTRQRNYILEKYVNNTIDDSATFNISTPITLFTIQQKNYKRRKGFGIRVGDFLTDLKQVAVYIANSNLFIVKQKSPLLRKAEIAFYTESKFKTKLNSIKIGVIQKGKTIKELSAWNILSSRSNLKYISLQDMCFFSKDPNVFSIFQGYEYDLVNEVNMTLIQPFINHLFYIICSSNQEIFRYLVFWLSYLFQNPNGKTETAIVLTGSQGCGKNTFTDVICHLLGTYANENATIDDVYGKFNNSILYKKLLVCNEVKSFIYNKNYDSDRMKTLITENTIDINMKFHDTIHQENICNFIFISNNFAPIKIEEGDRRYVVIEVSSKKVGDTEYFRTLRETFTDEFYSNLLTWLMKIDTTEWDRFNIPLTPAKLAIMQFSKSPYFTFIKQNVRTFIYGYDKIRVHNDYKSWCKENGFKTENVQEIRVGVLRYCNEQKKQIGTKVVNVYKLREEVKSLFIKVTENDEEETDLFVE